MNKTDLVKVVAGSVEKSQKDVSAIIDCVFDTIGNTLVAGEDVKIYQFGTFKSVAVDERTARNPQDGSTITVPAHNKVKFTVAAALKDAVR